MARLALLVSALILALPVHFVARLGTRHSPVPRGFLALVARIIGARVDVIGTPLRRNAFFVANHVSWIDIPALAGTCGTAFVAKAEVARVPVIGWLCSLNRTIFVQREARLNVRSQIGALSAALAEGWCMAVFPEGTTTDGSVLLPFKSAMLKVLEPAPPGVWVQPVFINYGPAASEISWVGDESGVVNAITILARPGTFPVKIQFLEPFHPDQFAGRKEITAEARARISAALAHDRGTHSPPPSDRAETPEGRLPDA